MVNKITSIERVLTTLNHQEPDKVPLFLLFSMYGAKEMGISIREYFSSPENVIKTQLYMKHKYNNDCLYAFYYAAIEIEAANGEIIFTDDGPPNAGEPLFKSHQDIQNYIPPDIKNTECLLKVLKTISG